MSAPEVRLESMFLSTQLALKCDHCGIGTTAVVGESQVMIARLKEHETTCPAIQLARLQARWDARGEALRALITEWRTAPERIGSGRMAIGYAAGRTDSADELERAMEDGR